MRKQIALTALAAATFFATTTPTQAVNRLRDPHVAQHAHSQVRHSSRRPADGLPTATVLLPSAVAAYMRGHLAIRPIHPLTSGIVRAL